MPADRDRPPVEASLTQNGLKFRYMEPAHDRNLTVCPHEMMPPHCTREDIEAVVRDAVSAQIANEPAASHLLFHPLNEAHDIGVAEVMGELSADHKVKRARWGKSENVAGTKGDVAICGV